MQNQKTVAASFIAFGMLIWFVLGVFVEKVFEHYDLTFGIFDAIKIAIPIFVAATVVVVLMRHEVASTFMTEVIVELRKVTWPSKKDTWAATFVVIVFVAVISLILGAIDIGWAYLVKQLIIR